MAKKTLGYVELEWECPTCDTRNPGSQRVCQNCGAPQPDDVEFIAPQDAELRTDDATVARATAGPDIHCPYCDARNPAGATVCRQCGGDLAGGQARQAGQVVAGFGTQQGEVKCSACATPNQAGASICRSCGTPLAVPAAAQVARAKPKPDAKGGGCLWIAVGLVVLVAIFGAFALFGGSPATTSTATAVEAHWSRTIEIQGLVPVQYTAWHDEIPGDATVGACTNVVRAIVDEPIRNAREVCGTPYAVDQGSGFAEVVVDCVYEVLEPRCEYSVNEWRTVDEVIQEGSGFSPAWPELRLDGRQREGDRTERYQCLFRVDDQTYSFDTQDYTLYQRCTSGSEWNLEISGSGRLLSAEPAQ